MHSINIHVFQWRNEDITETDDILVLEVLQELELAVGSLRQNWRAERLHNLLDSHGLPSKLVLCGAVCFPVSRKRF